jgi:hypothetical protein
MTIPTQASIDKFFAAPAARASRLLPPAASSPPTSDSRPVSHASGSITVCPATPTVPSDSLTTDAGGDTPLHTPTGDASDLPDARPPPTKLARTVPVHALSPPPSPSCDSDSTDPPCNGPGPLDNAPEQSSCARGPDPDARLPPPQPDVRDKHDLWSWPTHFLSCAVNSNLLPPGVLQRLAATLDKTTRTAITYCMHTFMGCIVSPRMWPLSC